MLGRVESVIGPGEQLQGIRRAFQRNQSERNGHLGQRVSIVVERCVSDRLAQALGGADGARHGSLREDQHELLAADPGREVGRPQVGAHELSYLQQHGVPGGMPVGVVDLFEMVDVHHGDAQGLGGVEVALHDARQRLVEPAPVAEAGEGVAQGRLLELPAQGDVLLNGVVVRAHSLRQSDQQADGELVRGLGKPPEGLFVEHEELRRLFRCDRRSCGAAREQRQLPDGLALFNERERRVIQFHAQLARDHDIDTQIRLTPPQQSLARC